MTRLQNLALTSISPVIWGSTYWVTTELLPPGRPVTMSLLRALPAGLVLLLVTRQLPRARWLSRLLLLGALNFTIFWCLLFASAYRLPGGVAATVGAIQPLLVVLLSRLALGTTIRVSALLGSGLGALGVGLVILGPEAALDPLGVLCGVGAAGSMAAGTVLSRKWRPPVSLVAFTSWQLTAGGLLLFPLAWLFEPGMPSLTVENVVGLGYLSLIGGALTYLIWLRGVERLQPPALASLGLLSPVSAVLLGWLLLGEQLSPAQGSGAALVLVSIALVVGRRGSQGALHRRDDSGPLLPLTTPDLVGEAELVSPAYAFTPHGTLFSTPATVELSYTGGGNVVMRLDDENDTTWELVESARFADGTASFEVNGFSVYAVAAAERECQPAACGALPTSWECGSVDDGCGGTIDLESDCGRAACGTGETCSDDHQCTSCVSTFSCATTTAQCGSVVDNCGQTHDVDTECFISDCSRPVPPTTSASLSSALSLPWCRATAAAATSSTAPGNAARCR